MTVVVPTYNRSATLARVLAAISAVEPPEGGFDVVVVDDGSAAEHRERLQHVVAEVPQARLVRQANAGPAAARNTGVRSSRAPLVVFLDDDCIPDERWLVELVHPFAGDPPGLGAVGGKVVPAPAENWAQRFCSAIEYATGTQPVFENASTQNACYRRDVFEEVGGFDERFRRPGGDDPDLSRRTVEAGYRLQFAPDAVVYHSELESYPDFVRHMYNRGLGEARIGRKFGRRRRVLMRIVLAPAFLGKIALVGWRRTRGKGSIPVRIAWAALEQVGYAAFVAGSAVGLARAR